MPASELPHATAQAAEQLVVRLLRLDVCDGGLYAASEWVDNVPLDDLWKEIEQQRRGVDETQTSSDIIDAVVLRGEEPPPQYAEAFVRYGEYARTARLRGVDSSRRAGASQSEVEPFTDDVMISGITASTSRRRFSRVSS